MYMTTIMVDKSPKTLTLHSKSLIVDCLSKLWYSIFCLNVKYYIFSTIYNFLVCLYCVFILFNSGSNRSFFFPCSYCIPFVNVFIFTSINFTGEFISEDSASFSGANRNSNKPLTWSVLFLIYNTIFCLVLFTINTLIHHQTNKLRVPRVFHVILAATLRFCNWCGWLFYTLI